MAGKKGRSGAISKLEKEIRQMVLDKCWSQLYFTMVNKKVKGDRKDRIAVALASKNIPQQIDANMNMTVVKMGRVIKDGKPLEFRVGNAVKS